MSALRFPVALAALSLSSLVAQTSLGRLTGQVSDASAASVVGADIEVRNARTGLTRSVQSDATGVYRIEALEPGDYDVTAKMAGFSSFVKRAVPVQAGSASRLDISMEVGTAATVVEVTAGSEVLLQAESVTRGGNISALQAAELPFSGRNPTALALTLPGVSTNRFGFGIGTFSVNGSRGRSNNFMLDGSDNNDTGIAGQAFQLRNPDAVAEVAVQTSNFDAEFGRAGGATVNTVTKAGTNTFHGSLFYLLDSTYDDAITNTLSLNPAVIARGRPLAGTENWFGGTLGGPVKKNKTFFFAGYHDQRQNSNAGTSFGAPTAGGWAALEAMYPSGRNPRYDLFKQSMGGLTATSQFFPVVMGDGRPNLEFGTAGTTFPLFLRDKQLIVRGDHSFSEKDQLMLRYIDQRQTNGPAQTNLPNFVTSQQVVNKNAQVNETHIFSPSMTNELRVSYARIAFEFPVDAPAAFAKTMPTIGLGGGLPNLGVGTVFPQGRLANNYTLQDTVSWIRGRHSIRMGVDLVNQRAKDLAPALERGNLAYGNTVGYSFFANFMDDFGGTNGAATRTFGSPANYPRVFRQAYFFQDRWRATQNLTITLGARYDYFGVPMNALPYAAFSGLFNVDPATLDGPYRRPSKVKADRNNWSPTLGVAWSPSFRDGFLGKVFGDKKSAIRTGYQIGYDTFFNNILSNAATSVPNLISTTTNSVSSAQLPRGLAGLSASLPTASRQPLPVDSQTLTYGDLAAPYTQRWSFGVQREVKGNMIADVSYVGTRGLRLFINEDLNPLVPLNLRRQYQSVNPLVANQLTLRLDTLQGPRLTRTNGGNSVYHGLQASLSRRMTKGLLANLSYTRSKNIDNSSEVFGVANVGLPQQSAVPSLFGGLRNERAVSHFDRPQRFVATFVYALPFGKSGNGFTRHTLGGWQVTGFWSFESGVPLTVTNGVDADGLGGSLDRPDYNPSGRPGVRAVPCAASATGFCNPDAANAAINPSDAMYVGLPAFTGNDPKRTGTLGRGTLRTPGVKNLDGTIAKTFRLTERIGMNFRAEVFNFINTPQYGFGNVSPFMANVPVTIQSSITGAPAGRFLQPQFADGGGRVMRYQIRLTF
ncbi:MAG: TonB-dependent receptor [Acidobacteria bacterium]|nr:TonB-dependent receptor [Acidobacteriota bacterium]